jgi:hypothetical protein
MQPPPRGSRSALCTACGTSTPLSIQPLFIVTGASGAGKTTLIPVLGKLLLECAVFDKDLLWGRTRDDQFYDCWLLIAHSQAQQNRPTVICGTIMPWELNNNPERTLVGTIYFLNLHCNDEVREQRLRTRPPWRQSSSDAFIQRHKEFAQWLLDNAATAYDPPMPTFDTSSTPVEEVAQQIASWIKQALDELSA